MQQKLITAEILKKTPALYANDGMPRDQIKVTAKFFGGSGSTWYMTEYDPTERMAFGFVVLNGDYEMAEHGYFSMAELETLTCPPFGTKVERDAHFGDHSLMEVVNRVREGNPL